MIWAYRCTRSPFFSGRITSPVIPFMMLEDGEFGFTFHQWGVFNHLITVDRVHLHFTKFFFRQWTFLFRMIELILAIPQFDRAAPKPSCVLWVSSIPSFFPISVLRRAVAIA